MDQFEFIHMNSLSRKFAFNVPDWEIRKSSKGVGGWLVDEEVNLVDI